jgi:hypothetical protein
MGSKGGNPQRLHNFCVLAAAHEIGAAFGHLARTGRVSGSVEPLLARAGDRPNSPSSARSTAPESVSTVSPVARRLTKPFTIIVVTTYGYATCVFLSRKLERATYDSVAFRFTGHHNAWRIGATNVFSNASTRSLLLDEESGSRRTSRGR